MARDPDAPAARLYLVTPPLAATAPFDAALSAAMASGDVACVLLRFATPDPGQRKKIARDLATLVQRADAALLVDEDTQTAARAGADGVHVEGAGEALDAAISAMKPDRIVGTSRLATRDECMTAGDMDVDYLMFGGPDDDFSAADILERTDWWADIFNVPCVAFAHDLADVKELAEAGADFVALEKAVWDHKDGPAAAVAKAMAMLVRKAKA